MKDLKIARMQMERAGYRNITDQQVEVYAAIDNPKLYYKLVDYAFRTAYWVNKHVEIMPGDSNYNDTYLNCLRDTMEDAYDLITQGKESYLEFMILTDREIVNSFLNDLEEESIESK